MNFIKNNFYVLTAGLLVSVFMSNDSFLPAIPLIAEQFNTSQGTVQLGVGLFVMGSLFLHLFVGPLSDKYGRRKVLILGGMVYLLGSIGCVVSTNIEQFLIARIFQGSAMSPTIVCASAAINEYFDEHKAIKALGISANITMLAPALGPIFGVVVLQFFPEQWRLIFVCNAIIGLTAWIFLLKYMPETHHLENRHTGSVFRLIKKLPAILRNKVFVLHTLSLAFGSFNILLWLTSGPIVLMTKLGLDKSQYAIYQTPIFVGIMLANFLAAKISRKIGTLPLIAIISRIMLFIGVPIMILTFFFGDKAWALVMAMTVYAFTNSLSVPVKNRYAINLFANKGSASGVLNQIIGIWVFAGSIFAIYLGRYPTWVIMLIISISGVIVGTCSLMALSVDKNS